MPEIARPAARRPRRRAGLLALATLGWSVPGLAADPSGEEIARRINARPRPLAVSRTAKLEIVDTEGTRHRLLRSFWKMRPDARLIALFAVEPADLKFSAYLASDYFDSTREDDQWIYRPRRKRAFRIGNPQRGEPILGSEFTLEDLKKEDRVEVGEYVWKTLASEVRDGRTLYVLEQTPRAPELARSLGISRMVSAVEGDRWMRRKIESWDPEGRHFRTLVVKHVEQIGGFWLATRLDVENHRNGSRSTLVFEGIDIHTEVPDTLFTVRALEKEEIP